MEVADESKRDFRGAACPDNCEIDKPHFHNGEYAYKVDDGQHVLVDGVCHIVASSPEGVKEFLHCGQNHSSTRMEDYLQKFVADENIGTDFLHEDGRKCLRVSDGWFITNFEAEDNLRDSIVESYCERKHES